MNYITIKEASANFNISERRIRQLIKDGRIKGVKKVGNTWCLPEDTSKPVDKRYKNENKKSSIIEFIKNNNEYFEVLMQ